MVVEISIGFVGLIAFFCYLGWRLKKSDFKSDSSRKMAVFTEIALYSFGGLLATSLIFILMESAGAASYYPVLRVVFYILMVIMGLVSSFGSVVAGIYLISDGLSKILGGGKN